jgi:RNA polymerase sigma-70 factor, ECF subfamily
MDTQLADETLIGLIVQRDTEAMSAFYDRHAQTVYSLIVRIVREPAVAEEILQETFWQVWQKASDYHGGGSATAWLSRIARNKSLDQLRRQKIRPQIAESDLEEPELQAATATSSGDVEQAADHLLKRQRLHQALATLPAEQRLCLELAYFEGMSQRELAEYTHAPLGTIKTRVRMGLEKMERLLLAAGYQAEDSDLG